MCEHKRIKSENCELSCLDCGVKLPADFLSGGAAEENKPVEADKSPSPTVDASEASKKTRKRTTKKTT